MSNLKFFVIIGYGLVLFSCGRHESSQDILVTENAVVGKSQLFSTLCVLGENINIVGDILSLAFLNRDSFVISTSNSSIFIYNSSGEQIREIRRVGRGPHEYQIPSIIRVYNDKIFVWCSQQLKLIVLDVLGVPIKEYKGFSKAVKDFMLYDNHLILYSTRGHEGSYVEVYDLEKEEYLQVYGKTSNEHLVLDLLSCSGGMTLVDDELLYASPNELSINWVNLSNSETGKIKLQDPTFNVKVLDSDANDLINKERAKVLDFLNKNSIITGLYATNDHVILKTEIGEFKIEDHALDNTRRFAKYYILDKQLDFKFTFQIEHDLNYNNCLFAAYGNSIYATSTHYEDNKFSYNLKELILPK